jgi:hypothetical protein
MTEHLTARVVVFGGDGVTPLGEGNYVGNVSVWFIGMPDGSIQSLTNAEEKPPQEVVDQLGGELIESPENPKTILDDGRTVYGCQVWWRRI